MNSYHQAILEATNNGKFPELGDLWRNYHPTSVLSDSEYYYEEACRFELTTKEEAITGSNAQKRLYVPVTRKVSLTDETKAQKSTCKVSDTDDTKKPSVERVFSPKTGKEYFVTVLD